MAKKTHKEKMARRKSMTKEEREMWDNCYDYFRYDLLGYKRPQTESEKVQSLPNIICLRLKGMVEGRFIQNYDIKSYGNYSFDILLNAMKFSRLDIQKALGRISFDDEQSKMMYVCAIIEGNLNTVYMRMKDKQRQEEKTNTMDISQSVHVGASYRKKTEEISSKFDDLW